MIEIKFRAKEMKSGMNAWVYGFYFQADGKHYIIQHEGAATDCDYPDNIRPSRYLSDSYYWEIDPDTLGQFTGLKDSKGNDIYGGDIVEDKFGRKYVVEYFRDWGAWMFYMPNDSSTNVLNPLRITAIDNFELKVVGNKIDNPELLEVTSE